MTSRIRHHAQSFLSARPEAPRAAQGTATRSLLTGAIQRAPIGTLRVACSSRTGSVAARQATMAASRSSRICSGVRPISARISLVCSPRRSAISGMGVSAVENRIGCLGCCTRPASGCFQVTSVSLWSICGSTKTSSGSLMGAAGIDAACNAEVPFRGCLIG